MSPVAGFILAFFHVGALLVIVWLAQRLSALRRERNDLLHQKDVVVNFVYDVGEVFAETESVGLPELLKRVLSYALQTTKAGAGALYLVDPEGTTLHAAAVAGIFPPVVGGVDKAMESAFSKVRHAEKLVREQPARMGVGVIGDVAARGVPVLVENAEMDARIPRFDEDFIKVYSLLVVPMRFRQQVLGVMAVVNRIDGSPFTQSDAGLLQALTDQAAVSVHYAQVSASLDEKRRLDHDLDIARQIQTALLPKDIPDVPGVELAAFCVPAQQIGGDYYDFVRVDDEHLGIAIADVAGKGISGAIMMAMCRSVLRIQAPGCLSPAAVLRSVNRMLDRDVSDDMFVSMLYMVLNARTRELTVARAGHPEPVVHSGKVGGASTVSSPGIAIGLADVDTFDAVIQDTKVVLKGGDTVVVYTDGVTEAQDQAGREWGVLNLVQTMEATLLERGSAERLAAVVREKLLHFVGDSAPYDDMTLVALRMERRE